MSNKRVATIELLRILLMLGVCLIHASGKGKYATVWPHNVLSSCVVGFVFISGYFGIRFSLSKVIRLYGLMIFYCILLPIIGGCPNGYISAVGQLWSGQKGLWFVHAYVIMCMVAPCLSRDFSENDAVNLRRNVLWVALPFLTAIFIWGWLMCFPSLACVVPYVCGLESQSFATFIGIFLVARLMRMYGVDSMVNIRICLLVVPLLMMIMSYRQYCVPHNCPISLVAITLVFFMFKRLHVNKLMEKCIGFIAPSMFGVYILQEKLYFHGMRQESYCFINNLMSSFMEDGWNIYGAYFVAGSLVFGTCLSIDVLRRLLFRSFLGKMQLVYSRLDGWFASRLSA